MKIAKDEYFPVLVSIVSSLFYATIEHYKKIGLQYVDVPAIVGITGACENVDTLFKVGNRLNLPLFFTQTGQLALEQALQNVHGVYTVIHSGRDEEIEDARHLRQFRLTEERMYEALLQHIEKATKAMVRTVVTDHHKIIAKVYGRDTGVLKEILERPYLRILYEDAVALLGKNGYPEISFGDDLGAEQEAKVVELVNKRTKNYGDRVDRYSPVFIMRYPKEIKFFNMKVSDKDPRVVLSADCIFPYSGEAVGSAVREHDGIKLLIRLLTSTMYKLHEQRGGTYDDFKWYTEGMILAQKTMPHAGYGIGNERIIQFALGHSDIRQCSLFSLMSDQTHDWDTVRRGRLPMIEHKKTVLLSIGKLENKEELLPYIKRIKNDGHIFYATDKTNAYLQRYGVSTTKVYKISQQGSPNLRELLTNDMFDLIVNIPTHADRTGDEVSDGRLIRNSAVETGTTLITDITVAQALFEKLGKRVSKDTEKQNV